MSCWDDSIDIQRLGLQNQDVKKKEAIGNPAVDTFVNSKGLTIQTYHYEAANPKGIVLCVHGYGTHFRFEYLTLGDQLYQGSWVERLVNAGYGVYGWDHQSFGLSDGWQRMRANVESFDDFIDDGIQFLNEQILSNKKEDVPVFLMGLSMGGCMAALMAERPEGKALAGVILLSPMLSIETEKERNKAALPLVDFLSKAIPHLPLARQQPAKLEEITAARAKDPLFYKGMARARMSNEILKAVDKVAEGAPQLTAPLLIIHSQRDTQCEPEGSSKFVNLVSSEVREISLLNDMWHNLANEPGNEKVFEEVYDFLRRHTEGDLLHPKPPTLTSGG
ncbi:unnamed protein product [Vitrella brassicaformis CCMP3155]|uniref:Serine aminopeptidase S33 domain-containing protein n=1 Tax=Vitrella brassicaformis (strain CCMP3155) TaxID=1169540 RepID=A0A0G4EJB8_VITBC|nr:unnamed protein product [Vitrella brassicaformis CCMP3155]|eukprot:CEL96834.1 unnamed protein product [Vitrella brassicaformis CCMP3155]